MLMTLTRTGPGAGDLGYLLHKHPDRLQSFEQGFGRVHVFYPEVGPERCTAALLLEIDPPGRASERPYVASAYTSLAIARVLASALAGRCKDRPEAAEALVPLEAVLTGVPGGEELLRQLFEPLGYAVTVEPHPLDAAIARWGQGPFCTLRLAAVTRLQDLLGHLYVLLPALDEEKHEALGADELERLLRHGEGWLERHPRQALVLERYRLPAEARAGLDPAEAQDAEEAALERTLGLEELRRNAVVGVLQALGARRVLDLGCGDGKLLRRLLDEPAFVEVVGLDPSRRALERARERLQPEQLPERQRGRLKLLQGALTYRDERLAGYDAATLVEVIEHLDPARLEALERVLFGYARPAGVVVTTPNAAYNVHFDRPLRHRGHRFEWDRERFSAWAEGVAGRHGYRVRFAGVGPDDPLCGPPTQLAVFERVGA